MSLLLVTLALAFQTDWPQYNGAASDRVSTEALDATGWADGAPTPVWSVETVAGFSSFTIGDGRAYTLVARDIHGDAREVCVALDLESGTEVWSAACGPSIEYDGGGNAGAGDNTGGDGPRTTPSYADGRVFVLDSNLVLIALDAKTGQVQWQHALLEEFDGRNIRWQNGASPLVEGGRVFVAGGGEDRSLLAFDAATGDVEWAAFDERMTHATPVAATLHGVRQVIFYVQSGLVAVAPDTGAELWRAPYKYKVSSAASPVVHGDMVFLSAGYGVGGGTYRIDEDGGAFSAELLWQTPNKQINHWSTPVCKDGFLYGMFSFKKYGEGPLACIDMRTGETQWSTPGFGPGNCIRVGDDIVALSDAGDVVIVEATPAAYNERARASVLRGKCWSSPAFADGQLYVRSTRTGVRLDLTPRAD